MNRILVLGGTGMLGAPAARRLKADGFAVRLMARDPEKAGGVFGEGFEIVGGDVADPASLELALQGCEGVHISVGGPVDQLSAENVAALAPGLGLARITYVSGSTVCEENGWFPTIKQKLVAEEAIRDCGVPYTILCPTWPMEQLPRFVMGGRAAIWGEQPTPITGSRWRTLLPWSQTPTSGKKLPTSGYTSMGRKPSGCTRRWSATARDSIPRSRPSPSCPSTRPGEWLPPAAARCSRTLLS